MIVSHSNNDLREEDVSGPNVSFIQRQLNWILSREAVLFSEGPLSEVLLTVLVLMVCLVLSLAGGVDKCLSRQLNRRKSTFSNMTGTLIKVGHYSRGNIRGRAGIIWWGIIQGRGWVLFEDII